MVGYAGQTSSGIELEEGRHIIAVAMDDSAKVAQIGDWIFFPDKPELGYYLVADVGKGNEYHGDKWLDIYAENADEAQAQYGDYNNIEVIKKEDADKIIESLKNSTDIATATKSSSNSGGTLVLEIPVYDGTNVKREKIAYQNAVSKYTIPIEFLFAQLQVSRNPEYGAALWDMVLNNSKIELVVQETCSVTEEYTVHRDGSEDLEKTTITIGVMKYIREADTWIVNSVQEYFKNEDITIRPEEHDEDASSWKKTVNRKITYKATPGGEVKEEIVSNNSSNNTVDPDSITGNIGTATEIPEEIKDKMRGKSYKEEYASIVGITWDDLRYCQIPYIDFNGNRQIGEMILNKSVAEDALDIFEELYNIGYPIEKMRLIDEYNASDYQSIEDNNTSAFNMRGTNGSEITPGNVSNHSKGVCIDINPQMNPWIDGDTGQGTHENAREYWNRDYTQWSNETAKKAYIGEDSEIYRIFTAHGWRWLGGGKESGNSDTQHFDKVN